MTVAEDMIEWLCELLLSAAVTINVVVVLPVPYKLSMR
jgi:hypothetical protein